MLAWAEHPWVVYMPSNEDEDGMAGYKFGITS